VHSSIYWTVAWFHPFEKEYEKEEKGALTVEMLNSVPQEMNLFDPRPLLLPTVWNTANAERLGDFVEEEKAIFAAYGYDYGTVEDSLVTLYGNRWSSGGDVEAIGLSFEYPALNGFGVRDVIEMSEKDSVLKVRLLDPGTGGELFADSVISAESDEFEQSWPAWVPVTFLVNYVDSFLLSGFGVLESSGYRELDLHLERLAFERLLSRGILPDGYYLVEIGF
tara:strand:- start:322 stop:987 length:666 start_codon:yes stop_codon:yes gene_type:complete